MNLNMHIKEKNIVKLVKMIFEFLVLLSGFITCSRHQHGGQNLNILAELRKGFILLWALLNDQVSIRAFYLIASFETYQRHHHCEKLLRGWEFECREIYSPYVCRHFLNDNLNILRYLIIWTIYDI